MNTTYATLRKYEKCTPNVGRKHGEKIPFGRLRDTKKSGALVRQQAIPTERPPVVGEVSANFIG
jgi:hypothetical protein